MRTRGSKLPLGAFSTESSPAVGASVFLVAPKEEEHAEGTVGGGGQNSLLGGPADGGWPAISSAGATHILTLDARNADHEF